MPKKKNFGSAADAFLGAQLPVNEVPSEAAEVKPAENKVEEPVAEVSVKPQAISNTHPAKERKTRTVLLKFTPSFYEEIKNAAEREGLAFNAYVTTVLMKAVK